MKNTLEGPRFATTERHEIACSITDIFLSLIAASRTGFEWCNAVYTPPTIPGRG